jgi:hypothetical protein
MGDHWRSVRVFACAALAFSAAACDTLDNRFFREGIGTEVYATDIVDSTRRQTDYFGKLCEQAYPSLSGGSVWCASPELPPQIWPLIVQAGLTDIDRRCNAYLNWLDERRRTNPAVIKQLGDTSAATIGIMRAAGVTATPITVVGLAFGLAANTFTNVNSRLLLEVDKTVVQAVVLRRRDEFRRTIPWPLINNRPAAADVLQSYLSICMPFTIETDINTTVAVYQMSGPVALDRRPPLVAPTVPRILASTPPPITPPPRQTIVGGITAVERSISLGSGQAIQRALCVEDTGTFESTTRTALRDFKAASLYPKDSAATDTIATDADLRRLRAAQRRFPSCQDAGFRNGYEVGLFSRFSASKMREDLKLALGAAGLPVPPGLSTPGAQPADAVVRQALGSLRMKYGLPGEPVFDRTFYDTMQNNLVR